MQILNKKNFLLLLIVLIAIILRVLDIIKPSGLSYDEAITYIDAINIFPFAQNLTGHTPLYFIILNLWMKIFSNNDISIRIFSVICGVLAVPVSYFIGKKLKDKTVGLVAAILMAINSIAIYYSQEARFYSLIILLSSILVLYFLKSIQKSSVKNIGLMFLFGILLLYTNIISAIFFGIILLELIILYSIKYKSALKNLGISLAISQVILIPFYASIVKTYHSNAQIIFETRYFDGQVIFSLLQSWFTPVITGIYNNQAHSLSRFFNNVSILSIIFVLVPIIISLIFIFKNNYKKVENTVLLTLAVLFIATEIILSSMGKFIINIRYTLFVLPVLIVLIANGFGEFKSKTTKIALLSTVLLINFFYFIFSPTAAFKQSRLGGQAVPAYVFKNEKINTGDIVIYQIRDNLSDKYYRTDAIKYKMINIFVNVFPKPNENIDNHTYYKNIFLQSNPEAFEKFYKTEIYNKLKPDNKLVIVSQQDFEPYNKDTFIKIISDDKLYKSQPFLFLKLYKIQDLLKVNNEKYKLKYKNTYKYQSWNISVYEK